MKAPSCRAVVFCCLTVCTATSPAFAADAHRGAGEIATNDNRTAGGRLANGRLSITLVAERGIWHPDGPGTLGVPIEAFGEPGKPLQIPGPLVRVPAGTTIVATLRNSLGNETLHVHDLSPDAPDVMLAPAQTRTVRFVLRRPGTYGYWAADYGEWIGNRFQRDEMLSGAIVVDDPRVAKPNDRIFVINTWINARNPDGSPYFTYEVDTLNGLVWPATERLSYHVGDTVRWRVYNASAGTHPMHLHGFTFDVDAVGDGRESIAYAPSEAPREVTHRIAMGDTVALHWRADRPGMWMYHCHIAGHTLAHEPLTAILTGKPEPKPAHRPAHVPHAMGGLVLAVNVVAPTGYRAAQATQPARRLGLEVRVADPSPANPKARIPQLGYRLRESDMEFPPMGVVGPAMVLTAGESVAVAVTNHLAEPTSVHWHGIDVRDSYDDGAANMAGDAMPGMRASPAIAPGETWTAHFTPTHPGTFAYHTHMDDEWQLLGGLVGPLIVMPQGQTFDAQTDHIVIVTSPIDHPIGDADLVNGEMNPAPIVIHANVPQRLRLINFTLFNADLVASLSDATAPMTWTPIAVDGNDLPQADRRARTATAALTIGQTRDFTVRIANAGHLTLGMFDTGSKVGEIPIDVVP